MGKPEADLTSRRDRSVKRARVLLKARLRSLGGEVDAWLKDLSDRGALLECDYVPVVGSEVVFKRGNQSIPARVAWSGGNKVGIEFHEAIDQSSVLVQRSSRPVVVPDSNEAYRRPSFRCADLSEEEKKLAESWGVTVGLAVEREWLDRKADSIWND